MTELKLYNAVGDFAGDKDIAAELRDDVLRPAITSGESITLDFAGVELATQSFIHALISELVRNEDEALTLMTFANCNGSVREVIEIVSEYSQEDVAGGNGL